MKKSNLKYFRLSFIFAAIGCMASLWLGWNATHNVSGALKYYFLAVVLSVLEVSLSIDNAVVNAAVLQRMTPQWQRRFLTWGIFIAVFGMRLIFPVVLVSVIAGIDPWSAFMMAATRPEDYAALMKSAHVSVAAFGGAFLLLVALNYFFRHQKNIYWIEVIEKPLSALGRLDAAQIGLTLCAIYAFSLLQHPAQKSPFLVAGIWGTVIFIFVDGLANFLHQGDGAEKAIDPQKMSMSLFLYLEVLDASFSFDGVVGAFAITNHIFIIMIGLGVGAVFVRSFTILLLDKGTLHEYRFLEHGAFYAIGVLSLIMFSGTVKHIPEVFTGLIGMLLIALSLLSSVRYNARRK